MGAGTFPVAEYSPGEGAKPKPGSRAIFQQLFKGLQGQ